MRVEEGSAPYWPTPRAGQEPAEFQLKACFVGGHKAIYVSQGTDHRALWDR